MTLAVSYARRRPPSARSVEGSLVICMGTAIAAQGDIQQLLPPRRLALQLGAGALAEALRAIVLSRWPDRGNGCRSSRRRYTSRCVTQAEAAPLLASLALRAPSPASRAALVAAVAARPFAFLAVSALGLVLQFMTLSRSACSAR